ncbi:MAG: hypothetical protein GC159_20725 [Phycisphaera sp.]|nr:hypothetical protein [Phycisphaera sp.]
MQLRSVQLIAVTLALVATAVACPHAVADDDAKPATPATPPTIDQLVKQLGAESFADREDAMTALMQRDDLDDDKLGAALRAARDPERRHRLLRVALHRFYYSFNPNDVPRNQGPGALGIVSISNANVVRPAQDPRLKRPAMIVSQTRPGFPAYVYLRPGDLIIGLGGQLFDDSLDQTDFSNTIQRYRAGEQLRIALLRGGKRVDVTLTLDSLQRLQDVHQYLVQYAQVQMDPRWRSHYARLVGDTPPVPTIVLDTPAEDTTPPAAR